MAVGLLITTESAVTEEPIEGASRWVKLIFIVLLSAAPAFVVGSAFRAEHGFLRLLVFGEIFLPSALPEVRALQPPTLSSTGYDGQFYAQIALAPNLARPDLAAAIDSPGYRARRIALPALAYAIGLGRPSWVLQVYAVLNLAFWVLLLVALGRWAGLSGLRERVLAASLLWTSGTWVSVELALTDLPALTVSLCGLLLAQQGAIAGTGLLSASVLFKETSALSFPGLIWIGSEHARSRLRWLIPLLVLPGVFWYAYVRAMLPTTATGFESFEWPLVTLVHKLGAELERHMWGEVGSALSVSVQAAYLMTRPRFQSSIWRWGIGFALLATVLGEAFWIEQNAYARVLLPLTAAFNLLLYQNERGLSYLAWLALGNFGLFQQLWSRPTRYLVFGWMALELWNLWRGAGRARLAAPHVAPV